MTTLTSPLKDLKIASPCTASWDRMTGDDRSRFCSECKLNVYNLSAMSKREAEALIRSAEGRLCVRYYQRTDGTIITQDCPVGVRAIRQRIAYRMRAVAAAVLTFLSGTVGLYGSRGGSKSEPMMGKMTVQTEQVKDSTSAPDTLTEIHPIMMGEMAIPSDTTNQSRTDTTTNELGINSTPIMDGLGINSTLIMGGLALPRDYEPSPDDIIIQSNDTTSSISRTDIHFEDTIDVRSDTTSKSTLDTINRPDIQ